MSDPRPRKSPAATGLQHRKCLSRQVNHSTTDAPINTPFSPIYGVRETDKGRALICQSCKGKSCKLHGFLPVLALEVGIALDVARDLHVTGGCEIEDGKRLATAYERIKRIAQVVRDAESEAQA